MKIRSPHFKKQYDLAKAELIGEGNFAQVFRVFDSDINDSLAIRKVKKNEADLEDISKQKVINEELRKVDNQNILKIYDIIDSPDAVWYITEYCSGGSLWDVLNLCKDNRMNEKECLECVLQISKGVQELHNHRITHRDLKPENILLKTKYIAGKQLPLVKLADFGLSTQKIIMETIAGTKEYIAPEQAKFHNYTNAVDVWSLGIICDQILHGNPFYSGENNKEVFSKILKMPYKVRDQNLRTSVKQFLVSLLKKKPYERPIIAVIRKTIEKILQQIEQEQPEVPLQKNKKSKSSNGEKQNDSIRSNNTQSLQATSGSTNSNNLGIHSRKVYQSGVQKQKQEPKKQTQKSAEKQKPAQEENNASNTKRQYITPASRVRQIPAKIEENIEKQRNHLVVPPPPPSHARSESPKDPPPLSPVSIKQIRQEKIDKQKQKVEKEKPKWLQIPKQEAKESKKQPSPDHKVQKIVVNRHQPNNIPKGSVNPPPVNQKITIYKVDRRKMITSNVKREQYKPQILDMRLYVQKIANLKKNINERCLKLQKDHSFIPNTHLHGNQFAEKCGDTEQSLKSFKKKLDFLNYFSATDDYQIRLIKGQNQLKKNRQICQQQIINCSNSIKQTFFSQLDTFIDQWVDKNIK